MTTKLSLSSRVQVSKRESVTEMTPEEQKAWKILIDYEESVRELENTKELGS